MNTIRYTSVPRLSVIEGNMNYADSVFTASYEEILTDYLISQPNLWLQPNPCPHSCQRPLSVNLTYNVIQVVKLSHSDETLIISGWFTINTNKFIFILLPNICNAVVKITVGYTEDLNVLLA
ncbi:unnamed protein product [Heterobilharzia americana]|nr:unnamed protein product [Heterobilharzia americana]